MAAQSKKWILTIAVLVVVAIVVSSYVIYVQEESRRGLATQSASEMLIDGPVLSGQWERRPYGGFGGVGYPTDTAGYSYYRNNSGTYDAMLWVGLWGYGSVDEARTNYEELNRHHGGNFSGYLGIGENTTSWHFDRYSQPINDVQVYWDHAYSIIVLKMNYWIDITIAYNDNSGINYDNVVQLAREQAAMIY
jgi:hypothetical protein